MSSETVERSAAVREALAGSLIKKDGGGDSGVEAFDGAGARDGEDAVGFGGEVRGHTVAFIADEQGDGAHCMELIFGRGLWNCRENGDVGFAEAGETFVRRHGEEGNSENAAGGGANGFGVPGADCAGERDDTGCAEGLGAAEDCAEVSGVLQAGEDEKERSSGVGAIDSAFKEVAPCPIKWMDEGGDELRIFSGEDGGEEVFWDEEGLRIGRKSERLEPRLETLGEEEAIDCEAGAEGFFDEVWAFQGDEGAGIARGFVRGSSEGAAKLLEAVVLLALYNANRHLLGARESLQ